MLRKLTHRLPIDEFEELREEASKRRISISDVIRDKLLRSKSYESREGHPNHSFPEFDFDRSHGQGGLGPPERLANPNSEMDFAIFEILYLLREFLFERNGQILKRVDEQMEKRFGKERKKIL